MPHNTISFESYAHWKFCTPVSSSPRYASPNSGPISVITRTYVRLARKPSCARSNARRPCGRAVIPPSDPFSDLGRFHDHWLAIFKSPPPMSPGKVGFEKCERSHLKGITLAITLDRPSMKVRKPRQTSDQAVDSRGEGFFFSIDLTG